MAEKINISDNILAAYAEGNVSYDERIAVRQYLMENPNELESVMMMMDEDYDLALDDLHNTSYSNNFDRCLDTLCDELNSKDSCRISHKILPATAMAAANIIDNLCAIRCEGIALRKLGIDITDEELLSESKNNGWLKSEGTALHNIGRLSGMHGMGVAYRYRGELNDIRKELQSEHIVIVAVDAGELIGDFEVEKIEDMEIGEKPDHVVVIESVNDNMVTVIDPSTSRQYDTYSITQFINAWSDSSFYFVSIYNTNEDYEPHPIDLSDVEISDDLVELWEAIAENAHEVWAYNRRQEGWKYGPERDDTQKLHPDMIAYSQLPESEKLYDREMAINTIKLVKKLGWDIVKHK